MHAAALALLKEFDAAAASAGFVFEGNEADFDLVAVSARSN